MVKQSFIPSNEVVACVNILSLIAILECYLLVPLVLVMSALTRVTLVQTIPLCNPLGPLKLGEVSDP